MTTKSYIAQRCLLNTFVYVLPRVGLSSLKTVYVYLWATVHVRRTPTVN